MPKEKMSQPGYRRVSPLSFSHPLPPRLRNGDSQIPRPAPSATGPESASPSSPDPPGTYALDSPLLSGPKRGTGYYRGCERIPMQYGPEDRANNARRIACTGTEVTFQVASPRLIDIPRNNGGRNIENELANAISQGYSQPPLMNLLPTIIEEARPSTSTHTSSEYQSIAQSEMPTLGVSMNAERFIMGGNPGPSTLPNITNERQSQGVFQSQLVPIPRDQDRTRRYGRVTSLDISGQLRESPSTERDGTSLEYTDGHKDGHKSFESLQGREKRHSSSSVVVGHETVGLKPRPVRPDSPLLPPKRTSPEDRYPKCMITGLPILPAPQNSPASMHAHDKYELDPNDIPRSITSTAPTPRNSLEQMQEAYMYGKALGEFEGLTPQSIPPLAIPANLSVLVKKKRLRNNSASSADTDVTKRVPASTIPRLSLRAPSLESLLGWSGPSEKRHPKPGANKLTKDSPVSSVGSSKHATSERISQSHTEVGGNALQTATDKPASPSPRMSKVVGGIRSAFLRTRHGKQTKRVSFKLEDDDPAITHSLLPPLPPLPRESSSGSLKESTLKTRISSPILPARGDENYNAQELETTGLDRVRQTLNGLGRLLVEDEQPERRRVWYREYVLLQGLLANFNTKAARIADATSTIAQLRAEAAMCRYAMMQQVEQLSHDHDAFYAGDLPSDRVIGEWDPRHR
ncbi:hypothetical protein N7466_001216 [Penicillium verhagenii]|uniref:uncharacterized protein n=1 Tax=Penicillium verhagenii TaxID=1562060 RepID=UPI002545B0C4|nr:uncharacterized protein N7466_001216 [Penicillium verhagenii]KAJ5948201.1 hypothetical protein N7466_001216 [Penicillium verhagenii]